MSAIKITKGIPIKAYPDFFLDSFSMNKKQQGYEIASVAPRIV